MYSLTVTQLEGPLGDFVLQEELAPPFLSEGMSAKALPSELMLKI